MVFTNDDKGEVKFTTTKTDGQLEISAEDFIKFAKEHENKDVSFSTSKEPDTFSTYFPFTSPTADAVDIVRCKDCKNVGLCTLYSANPGFGVHTMQPNDFCSLGQKTDNIEINVDWAWIPTAEELPEEGKYVLLYFKEGYYCPDPRYQVGYLGIHDIEDNNFVKTGEKQVWYTNDYYYDLDMVSCWLPIPEICSDARKEER